MPPEELKELNELNEKNLEGKVERIWISEENEEMQNERQNPTTKGIS